ncbi:hypothetical protein AB0I28_32020 [Phytomonospora sp. NPDC050363]|uniref:hypothetical protein n=1 Tax=Phytomonospora sp. NPDC050363 TaxID=3155642 RepID=UPI00340722F1
MIRQPHPGDLPALDPTLLSATVEFALAHTGTAFTDRDLATALDISDGQATRLADVLWCAEAAHHTDTESTWELYEGLQPGRLLASIDAAAWQSAAVWEDLLTLTGAWLAGTITYHPAVGETAAAATYGAALAGALLPAVTGGFLAFEGNETSVFGLMKPTTVIDVFDDIRAGTVHSGISIHVKDCPPWWTPSDRRRSRAAGSPVTVGTPITRRDLKVFFAPVQDRALRRELYRAQQVTITGDELLATLKSIEPARTRP